MRLADRIAMRLEKLGVRHVFGVSGANIEDLFAALHRRGRPRIVLSKHEHAAGTAADAYARIDGRLGVVLVTSGGGAMNLVHAIAEARASDVPLLALVGEPPTALQGHGAFQDTSGRGGAVDAAAVFGAVARWCARPERPAEVLELLETAIDTALGERGPAVLLLPKDWQEAEIGDTPPPTERTLARGVDHASTAMLERAATLLEGRAPIVIVAGDEVPRSSANEDLARLARALHAEVSTTPDARDAFDNTSPRFLGVTGAMGHSAVGIRIAAAGAVVLAGTRLPFLARSGLEPALHDKPIVSLGHRPPFVTSPSSIHLGGAIDATLRGLLALLPAHPPDERAPSTTERSGPTQPDGLGLTSQRALAAVERALPDGAVVLVDAGNTGASAVHHLAPPRAGRWLLAMGMAGMGYTFGAAVGAACASGRHCYVLAGDGAFFMQGLDIHTAIEHALPIVYLLFNNGAHGMCLVRERLLLGEDAGFNTFRTSHLGTGLAATFPGLAARDCRTASELDDALEAAAAHSGPSVIAIELDDVEVPPFAPLRLAGGDLTSIPRRRHGHGR